MVMMMVQSCQSKHKALPLSAQPRPLHTSSPENRNCPLFPPPTRSDSVHQWHTHTPLTQSHSVCGCIRGGGDKTVLPCGGGGSASLLVQLFTSVQFCNLPYRKPGRQQSWCPAPNQTPETSLSTPHPLLHQSSLHLFCFYSERLSHSPFRLHANFHFKTSEAPKSWKTKSFKDI